MILTALKWLWTFVSPWLGPVVTRWAPWLVPWLSGFSLRRALRAAGIAAAFTAVIWATWRLARPDPDAPVMVSVEKVEAQRWKAKSEGLEAALAKATETVRQREREAALADQYIEALKAEKEALRALSSDPDAPVFAADDPWLRGRR